MKTDNTQHTPGPWKVNTAQKESWNSVGLIIHAPDGSAIAMSGGYNSDECKSNARLIAAAPKMLEALKEAEARLRSLAHIFNAPNFTDRYDDGPLTERTLGIVTDAIAQAEGK